MSRSSIDPYKIFTRAFLILLSSLLLGIIIPGLIANHNGVFYHSTLRTRLPTSAKELLGEYEQSNLMAKARIKQIDSIVIFHDASGLDMQNLLNERVYYESKVQNSSPPIQLMPFYLNPVMYVWFAMYAALGWLIVLLNPNRQAKIISTISFKRTVILTLSIYAVYNWTVWMRNFVLNNENRVVYSFANYDISSASFFTQEANTFIFALLLSIVLQLWIAYFLKCYEETKSLGDEPIASIFDGKLNDELSRVFLYWQISSLILALGFIDFTGAFWDLIIYRHDQRYLLAGITIHSIWGITWVVISLPMLIKWYQFQNLKSRAIFKEISQISAAKEHGDIVFRGINELNPLGLWNIAASGIIAIFSFILPILHAFLK